MYNKYTKKPCSLYSLGNELFKSMLDSRMNYTCAIWNDASNLEEAQLRAKLGLMLVANFIPIKLRSIKT